MEYRPMSPEGDEKFGKTDGETEGDDGSSAGDFLRELARAPPVEPSGREQDRTGETLVVRTSGDMSSPGFLPKAASRHASIARQNDSAVRS